MGPETVVRQAIPRLDCGCGYVARHAPGSPQEERLIGQLLAEMSGPPEPAVALRGRQRWVRGFEPVRLAPETAASSLLAEEGGYLIAGAAHGTGMRIAGRLVRRLGARDGRA